MAHEGTDYLDQKWYMPETDEEWSHYHGIIRTQFENDVAMLRDALLRVIEDPWHGAGIAHKAIIDFREMHERRKEWKWQPEGVE